MKRHHRIGHIAQKSDFFSRSGVFFFGLCGVLFLFFLTIGLFHINIAWVSLSNESQRDYHIVDALWVINLFLANTLKILRNARTEGL